jgi:beta-lactam-binding protein with PASTA domain
VPTVAIPGVASLRLEDATQRLRQVGLEPAPTEQVTLDTPRGVVVTQDPPAGTVVRKGERVRLLVSQGVELPNLLGQQWDDVKPWLDRNGWTLGRVRFVFADYKDFGKVVAQDPPSGAVADKNTPINLSIAGPPEATRTGLPRPNPPPPQAVPPPAPPPAPPRGEQGRGDREREERGKPDKSDKKGRDD